MQIRVHLKKFLNPDLGVTNLQLPCNFEKKKLEKHPQKGSFSRFLYFSSQEKNTTRTFSAVQNSSNSYKIKEDFKYLYFLMTF